MTPGDSPKPRELGVLLDPSAFLGAPSQRIHPPRGIDSIADDHSSPWSEPTRKLSLRTCTGSQAPNAIGRCRTPSEAERKDDAATSGVQSFRAGGVRGATAQHAYSHQTRLIEWQLTTVHSSRTCKLSGAPSWCHPPMKQIRCPASRYCNKLLCI